MPAAAAAAHHHPPDRGLHSLTSELNLRTFGNTSLPLELNLSTLGPHPLVIWVRPLVIWVLWETKSS